MLLTTTNHIHPHIVQQYLGMVTGEVILGANVIRDIFAYFRDFFGGRAKAYEEVFIEAREKALQEIEANAREMGANAVIAIDLDYEVVGSSGSIVMVSATGTAVIIANTP